jgi:hypothetical protein
MQFFAELIKLRPSSRRITEFGGRLTRTLAEARRLCKSPPASRAGAARMLTAPARASDEDVLQTTPPTSSVLRSYAAFLITVCNDTPAGALRSQHTGRQSGITRGQASACSGAPTCLTSRQLRRG